MGFDNNVPGVQAAVSSLISPFSEKVTSVTLCEDTGLVIGNMLQKGYHNSAIRTRD